MEKVGWIIGAFVALIFGLIMVTILSDQFNQVSNGVSGVVLAERVAEGYGDVGGRFQLAHSQIQTVYYVTNATNNTAYSNGTAFYYWDNEGDKLKGIIGINGVETNTSGIEVTYDYGTSTFVGNASARNLMPTAFLFTILAVVIAAFVYAWYQAREIM